MLLVVPALKLSINPKTQYLLSRAEQFFTGQGIPAYVTGGFVRDSLLGRETADIDITAGANALELAPQLAAALGGKAVPLDITNRVARIIVPSSEAAAGGSQWEIDLTTLKGDIDNDLRQRDFTIDAMAVELGDIIRQPEAETALIDPSHGQADLHQHIVRATSETALISDAARMLRAVRLAAELDFTIDTETEGLIRRHGHRLTGVAAERVREELLHLLARDTRFLCHLDELGLLTTIIPELGPLKGVKQPPEHFWDVFDHSLETVAAVDYLLRRGDLDYGSDRVLKAVPWSVALAEHFEHAVSRGSTRRTLLKLAALLHDITKPQTKVITENGRMRFLRHAQTGAEVAAAILERLRFSSKETGLVEAMVRHHLRPGQLSREGMPTRRAIYRYFRDTAGAAIDTLYLSLADHLAARGPRLKYGDWQQHAEMVDYILAQRLQEQGLTTPPKLIDGHNLMDAFGLKPGPLVGELLESVREAQAASEVKTRDEALAYVKRQLSARAGRYMRRNTAQRQQPD